MEFSSTAGLPVGPAGVKPTDDLGQLVADAARIQPLTGGVEAVAARYGGAELMAREEARDAEQKLRIAGLRRRFVEGPVLVVARGRGAVVNTTGVTPIPEGTVYFEYRVTAEWGTLASTGVLPPFRWLPLVNVNLN